MTDVMCIGVTVCVRACVCVYQKYNYPLYKCIHKQDTSEQNL